jgi:hypothetical protein
MGLISMVDQNPKSGYPSMNARHRGSRFVRLLVIYNRRLEHGLPAGMLGGNDNDGVMRELGG